MFVELVRERRVFRNTPGYLKDYIRDCIQNPDEKRVDAMWKIFLETIRGEDLFLRIPVPVFNHRILVDYAGVGSFKVPGEIEYTNRGGIFSRTERVNYTQIGASASLIKVAMERSKEGFRYVKVIDPECSRKGVLLDFRSLV